MLAALGVLLLLGATWVADRLAEEAAERALAGYLADVVPLDAVPVVEAQGFPFLTQAVRGEYDDVRVVMAGVRSDPVRVDRLAADLSGVQLPLGDLVRGAVTSVPVERSAVRARVTYDDVNALLAEQERPLTVGYGGPGELRVLAVLTVLGQTVEPSADASLEIDGPVVRFIPRAVAISDTPLGVDVPDGLASRLTVEVGLPDLPYGQVLERVVPTEQGLQVQASGRNVVLQ